VQPGATHFHKLFEKNNLQKKYQYHFVTQKFPIFQRGIQGVSLKKKANFGATRCNPFSQAL